MTRQYLKFLKNYDDIELRKSYFEGVRYIVTREDTNHYYLGNVPFSKNDEGTLYVVGDVISPRSRD